MKKEKNSRYYCNVAIGLLFMLFFRYLPPFGQVTSVGMAVTGIFIGMIWLWLSVDGLWPSVLALLVTAFSGYLGDVTGYAAVTSVFTTALGNNTIIMVILFMSVFGCMGDIGLAEYIARFLLRRKFLAGKAYVLLFMIVFASYVLCGLGDFVVCLFIMWPIVEEICKKAGYQKGDKYWNALVCGVFFGCAIGQPLLPFKGMVAGLLATFDKAIPGYSINFGAFFAFNFIMAILIFVLYCLVVRLVIRPDVSGIKTLQAEDIISAEKQKMLPVQKLYLALITLVILGVLIPNFVKSWKWLSDLGIIGVIAIMLCVVCVLRTKEGTPLVNIRMYLGKTFNWTMVWQMAAAIYIASALTADVTGVRATLVSVLQPSLAGVPTAVFVALIVAFTVVITNFANNMVVGVIMINLISAFLQMMPGLNPSAATVMVILSACIAFLLPSASVYAAILHSRKDLVEMKDIAQIFVPIIIVVILAYCLIGYPLANLMF